MIQTTRFRIQAALLCFLIAAARHATGLISRAGFYGNQRNHRHSVARVADPIRMFRQHSLHAFTTDVSSEIPSTKPPPGKMKSPASEEFKWLNWVYRQWKPQKAGELSEEVIKQMIPAISRWGQRKEIGSAERAEELLERIIEENIAKNPDADLTVSMFNAAMNGHAKIGNPLGAQRILRRMEELRSKHDHLAHLKPDVFSMSTLATAWAKSRVPEAAAKGLNILDYMDVQKICPNTITYNAVLHAIATGHQIDKAILAEDIVKRMVTQAQNGEDCKPDIFSYQCLIQAWANTSLPGSPQRAEQILKFLDQEAENGNQGLEPNVYCFTSESFVVHPILVRIRFLLTLIRIQATIHAWAKSSECNRARSAYEILQHMRKRYMQKKSENLKPNVVAFTAVLNACSRPVDNSERMDAFQIAQLTRSELSIGIYGLPNFLSYAAFLSVCATTLDSGEFRDRVVRSIFDDCAKAGQMGQIVLEKLKQAASSELYEDLVGIYRKNDGSYELPRQWTMCLQGERNAATSASIRKKGGPLSESSKLRLKAVEKFGGKSGIYSSGVAVKRFETVGISWSIQSLGS